MAKKRRKRVAKKPRRMKAAIVRTPGYLAQPLGVVLVHRATNRVEHADGVLHDALTIHTRSAEQRLQGAGLADHVSTRPRARSDRHEGRDALGVMNGHRLADHSAHRDPHDERLLETQMIEQANGVRRHVLELVRRDDGPSEEPFLEHLRR